ncbi:placenta-specific gene 8 protein-like [Antedon mediterranea]|uniref:placenta-specific gene 8 protein-like n=1 Tax=Antedon mediterranea TaxID=105859 RepID=UPI003AF4646D
MAQTTVVVQQQPQPMVFDPNLNLQGNQQRDWSTGLFGCLEEITPCLLAFCCPTIAESYLACEADESCIVPCCVPGAPIAIRTKLRTQYGIRGSLCNDCAMYYCCVPCVVSQMIREINNVRMGRTTFIRK